MKVRPNPLPPQRKRRDLAHFGEKQRALLELMLDGYRAHRGSRRHRPLSVEGDEATVLDFLAHAGRIPGEAVPSDFERWSNHLYVERDVAASTQRKYQTAVRVFFDYLIKEPRYRNEVRRTLGVDIVQVSTPENSIVHRRERETERKNDRRAFTEDEVVAFLGRIDLELAFAWSGQSKAIAPIQRDKTLFSVALEMGLRADEVLGLNIDSFEKNPDFKEFGNFGMARIFGKGQKWRTVTIMDPAVSEVLSWYLREVRPRLARMAAPGEMALFLSERGTRLSYGAFLRQFSFYRDRAGLSRNLVPHCLRHTSLSAADMGGLSLYANCQRAGHVNPSTTQTYLHHPDSFTKNEFNRMILQKIPKTPSSDL